MCVLEEAMDHFCCGGCGFHHLYAVCELPIDVFWREEEVGSFQGNGVIFEASSDIPSDTLMGMRAWRFGRFYAKITGGA